MCVCETTYRGGETETGIARSRKGCCERFALVCGVDRMFSFFVGSAVRFGMSWFHLHNNAE